ncbi:MAG TPA: hypothetical protein VFS40_10885 [Gemmatimonadales bacterium]|nr:hypothetical protein [Gemmatimonadales bacterium]
MLRRLSPLLPLALLAACNPATTRPAFAPLPEAPSAAVAQPVPAATEQLAAALRADGVPLARVAPRDGFIESPWFDARSGRPHAHGAAGAVGTDVVRVRAWVEPIDRRRSTLTLEAVYHAVTDPSLPPRELDRPLPPQHPLALRLRQTLDSLAGRPGR